MPLRLVTISVSHYCEKARWALERAGIGYEEDGHAPLFHRAFTMPHGATSTPLLVTPHGVLKDSTDILRFADRRMDEPRRLYPEGPLGEEAALLEDRFDQKLGPATRALAYSILMPEKQAFLDAVSAGVSRPEALAMKAMRRPIVALMRKGLRLNEGTRAWAEERVRSTFGDVATMLEDGRRYLTGDRFTAADLTFAALADPVVDRDDDAHARYRSTGMPLELVAIRRELRSTPAGEFVARLFRDDRR
jgi:glutathione S-transferase